MHRPQILTPLGRSVFFALWLVTGLAMSFGWGCSSGCAQTSGAARQDAAQDNTAAAIEDYLQVSIKTVGEHWERHNRLRQQTIREQSPPATVVQDLERYQRGEMAAVQAAFATANGALVALHSARIGGETKDPAAIAGAATAALGAFTDLLQTLRKAGVKVPELPLPSGGTR